jgi:uncharacterized protein YjbI with pentapeptide repeats
LLQLAAGLFATGALWFTARNYRISRATQALAVEQYRLSERGQTTERFARAIEQLGSTNVDVRIGSVYTLERLARDSGEDHPAIMEILSSFVCRKTTEEAGALPAHDKDDIDPPGDPQIPRDVQAALTVIARRNPEYDQSPIDLHGARLAGAELTGASLRRADLRFTDLRRAHLHGADLEGAYFCKADLSFAYVHGANMTKADLRWAILFHLWANGTDLREARFWGADLRSADLYEADLRDADLGTGRVSLVTPPNSEFSMSHYQGPYPDGWTVSHSDFPAIKAHGAILLRAKLQRANLEGVEDLNQEQLAAAADTEDARVPVHLAPSTSKSDNSS